MDAELRAKINTYLAACSAELGLEPVRLARTRAPKGSVAMVSMSRRPYVLHWSDDLVRECRTPGRGWYVRLVIAHELGHVLLWPMGRLITGWANQYRITGADEDRYERAEERTVLGLEGALARLLPEWPEP